MPESDKQPATPKRAPDYWLRRRAGKEGIRLSTAAAAMVAQRADAVGDLYRQGLIWQESDDDAYSGLIFVTLTPVWEQR